MKLVFIRWFTVLFLLISLSINGSTQGALEYLINTRHLDLQDGLSHRIVNSIHQDRNGFIWIGTESGIDRYDGFEFKNWSEKDGLPFRQIHHILEDDKGLFWLFTNSIIHRNDQIQGIVIFNPYTFEHTSISEQFKDGLPFDLSEVTNYFSSSDGRILFITPGQLWEYQSTKGFTKLDIPDRFIPGSYGGDSKFYGTLGDSLIAFTPSGTMEVLIDRGYADRILLWLTKDKLLSYEGYPHENNDPDLVLISLNGDYSKKILIDPFYYRKETQLGYNAQRQEVWVVDGGIIKVFNLEGELLYNSESENTSLLERAGRVQFFDDNNTVWIGTSDGIHLVNLKESPFKRLIYTPSNSLLGMDGISCRGIIEADDFLYVNSHSGKLRIDLKTGDKEALQNVFPREENKANRPFPYANSRRGFIWTGTEQLIAQRGADGEEIEIINETPLPSRIWSIYEDQERVVWIGGAECGLYYSDLKAGGRLTPFPVSERFERLSKSTILHITEDDNRKLILSTDNGLYRVNRSDQSIERYWSGGKGKYYLPADKFQHTLVDSLGVLWLATDGSGLIRWDTRQNKWKQFAQADGFSNSNIYAVYADDQGYLWLSSDYGIMRFNKKTFDVRKYFEEDGISHYEFNRISHYQNDQGILYFGSLNGITAFDPKILNRHTQDENQNKISLVYIAKREWRKPKFVDVTPSIVDESPLVLNHDERNLVFKFKSDNYLHSDRLRFFYQLEGLNNDWVPLNGNELRIHELRIGEYRLRVKAQNPDGSFSAKPLDLAFRIKKPFTHTYWFLGGALLLIALLVWRVLEWKVSRLKKRKLELEQIVLARTEEIRQQAEQVREDKQTIEQQAAELKELAKTKSRFFANISHELRTPLSLILGPLDQILRRNRMEPEDLRNLNLMRQHGTQLISRIDELLDLARMESSQLEVREEPALLYQLLKEQIASFRPFALQKNIQLSFEYKADPELCIRVDGDKLKKIQGNLISNALKYVENHGIVEVVLSDLGNILRLDVRDNGPGIHQEDLPYIFDRFYRTRDVNKKALSGTGIGLSLSRELAKVMNGWIEVESKLNEGSCFSFFFNKVEVMASSLKMSEESDLNLISTAHESLLRKNQQKGKILIVEDHQDLRNFLASELADYQVIMAANGVEAIEKLKVNQTVGVASGASLDEAPAANLPDLIISDIMMPEMDGLELLIRLKSSEEWQHIPVVMLTARTGEADKLQALRIGVDDYMVKPFDPLELQARVANLIERAGQRSVPVKEEASAFSPPVNTAETQQWLKKVEELVLKQISQPDFTLDRLAADLFISKRQLQRKLKAYTGMTANHYIREIRLHQARQFIENEEVETLSELSYAVGFTDPHYFSTLYQKRYGKKPLSTHMKKT